ncbi:RNA recognition motif domain-containing protein [Ditylenchus destructor]|nr:RNA recognition motif domain-containing protein [Ditylenchus destructor]
MLSLFRSSRIYSNQLSNNRRQLCVFTSIFSIPSNKFFNTVVWTPQIYALRNFSSNSGSDKFDDSRPSERDSRTVMVAGLSKHTTTGSLRQYFIEKKWDVTDCQIIRHKKTGVSREFGFVEFATVEQAELASKDCPFIDSKNVTVKMKGDFQRNSARYFSQFGDIFTCDIVYNDDNLSKGFGFVTFKSQESLDRALNSQSHSIDSKVVDVRNAGLRRQKVLTLGIRNLSPQTNDESLREYFSKYGQLAQCNVKTDPQTGQSRGFGYVGFATQEEVYCSVIFPTDHSFFQLDRVLNDQPHVIDGVEVEINYSTPELDLVVNSLPQDISQESLKKSLWDFFSRYGRVRDCRFIENAAGNTTAFVAMSSKDEVTRALARRPHYINGKLVHTHQKAFSLYVAGLPEDAVDEDLYNLFSEAGKLVYWEVMRDRKNKTNQPIGYGFVSFSTPQAVARAIENQPYFINGSMLRVERRHARSKKEKI